MPLLPGFSQPSAEAYPDTSPAKRAMTCHGPWVVGDADGLSLLFVTSAVEGLNEADPAAGNVLLRMPGIVYQTRSRHITGAHIP
jgi:hypothetical protein